MAALLPLDSIRLRGAKDRPLQSRLIEGMIAAILEARCLPGTRLPSTRELAGALGVSRMTVTLVYAELGSLGYIASRPRSGFVVAETVPNRRVAGQAPSARGEQVAWGDWLGASRPRQRVIRKPADWRSHPYPFLFGQADPRLFDHAAWRDCARRALGARDFGGLTIDLMTRDDPMLIDHICSSTLPRRGIAATPDQVLITVGSQNALYIALQILADPGRPVAIEEPGYPDFAETLRARGVPMRLVPVDAGGMDVGAIPPGTRIVIATPSHHIPTGATMPMARREALLRRASDDDLLVIEDDYDFEMSYLVPPMPALKSMDDAGRVIYLGSFSKSLFPGLRLGYLVASAPLIEAARALRAMILRHPPTQLQRVTAYFLAQGHYDTHITRLRAEMARRRAAVIAALEGTPFRIAGADRAGGTSLWMLAPPGIDSGDLARQAAARGVLIESGAVFFENPPAPCPCFRLGFGSIAVEQIAPGIAALAEALAETPPVGG